MKKLIVLVAVSLLLTVFLSNLSAISLFSGFEKKSFDMQTLKNQEYVTVDNDNPLLIDDVDAEMKNVCLTLGGDDLSFVNVKICYTDDNFTLKDGFDYNHSASRVQAGLDSRSFITVSSYGKVGTLRVTADDPIEVKSVDINAVPGFSFSMLMFFFITGVLCCAAFGVWKKPLDSDNSYYLKICTVLLCLTVVLTVGVIHRNGGADLLVRLPEDVTDEDQFLQLFDAFHKGRLDLDIDYDMDAIAALDNPYDRTLRNEAGLHGAFWDRAYYNGKLYSYFGAAPVFTVYYPIYTVTRKVPTTLLVSEILCLFCVIFISQLYGLFIKKFCKDVSAPLAVFGQAAVVFGSCIFGVAAELKFYYIAVLSGIAWTAAFLYFLFSAYWCDNFKRRVALLALAGVSVVLIVTSRPTLLLYCFIGIIPALYIFKSKEETKKNKIIYAASVGVPIVIGAVAVMIYNKARFDSPFEFGFNYQLTVSRAQANTIKLSMIYPTLFHYYFEQPSIRSSFPFMRLSGYELDNYTRYNYVGRTMGILNYPLNLGAFLLPFTVTKKDKFKTAVLMALVGAPLLMSFIDMCKAGVHYRYTADIAFIFMLVSVIAVFDLLSLVRKHSEKAYAVLVIFTAAAMTVTVIIGGLLTFANESETLMGSYPEAVAALLKM